MTMGIKPLDFETCSRSKALSRFKRMNASICDSVLRARYLRDDYLSVLRVYLHALT